MKLHLLNDTTPFVAAASFSYFDIGTLEAIHVITRRIITLIRNLWSMPESMGLVSLYHQQYCCCPLTELYAALQMNINSPDSSNKLPCPHNASLRRAANNLEMKTTVSR